MFPTEAERNEQFPITRESVFLGHAAVTALPACVAHAMAEYAQRCATQHQEFGTFLDDLKATRKLAADLIGAKPGEVALLGPTSLGLNMFANGIDWQPGDEIVCYFDDYPANVYPWMDQQRKGAKVTFLQPEVPGQITPELVEAALTPKTRLVALASCHYLTGYRVDIDAIGRMLGERGVLFSLDAIQTCGAFPTPAEHVDFMCADAHKWMLGPMAIGIFYVKEKNFEVLRPSLVGAWNVHSPEFIAQEKIEFMPTAQRYEPGVLNSSGMYGLGAALEMFSEVGHEVVSDRLLELKAYLVAGLDALGCEIYGPRDGAAASSITTFKPPGDNAPALFAELEKNGVIASCRQDRAGTAYLRFSPHFYNTEAELDRALELLSAAM